MILCQMIHPDGKVYAWKSAWSMSDMVGYVKENHEYKYVLTDLETLESKFVDSKPIEEIRKFNFDYNGVVCKVQIQENKVHYKYGKHEGIKLFAELENSQSEFEYDMYTELTARKLI